MKDELRAITKNQRSLDSAVMMSSLMPSEKYSCSGSPLMLTKGKTAIDGRSGKENIGARAWIGRRRKIWSCECADETEPFARDGADQALLLAAVADGPARGVDAAGQGRI